MDEPKKKIIVPWDFREEAKVSLLHAFQLAQVRGDDIVLLTTIEKPGLFGKKEKFTEQHIEFKKQIESAASAYNTQLNEEYKAAFLATQQSQEQASEQVSNERVYEHVEITGDVLCYNNLKNDFRDYYFSNNANLVVTRQYVGQEGKKPEDMVDFLLKVKSSRQEGIPFIIVNKAPSHKYYTDLVVPVTPNRTFKETVRWIIQISSYYHCNVNLIRPPALNDQAQKFDLSTNINFVKKYLDEQDIVYGLKTGNRKSRFEESVFEFVNMIEADLLILMSDQFSTYFTSKVVNVDTPVMFINPLLKKFQSFN